MKFMLPAGKVCDLACYFICPGYYMEGCLMFNEAKSFYDIKMELIASRIYFWQLSTRPGGVWKDAQTIEIAKDVRMINYKNEKIH